MRRLLLVVPLVAFACSKEPDPPPIKAPIAPVVQPSVAPVASAEPAPSTPPVASTPPPPPAPVPIVKLSTAASTTGWKQLDTKLGFSLQYPPKNFTAKENVKTATLTSKLFVDAPHGIVEKGQKTEHRFSARFELRKEALVATMKKDLPYAVETCFPGGTTASFKPSEEFAFKTQVAGKDAYVILFGAHGYSQRAYYVEVDPGRTLVVQFDVITDYLAHVMPKKEAMSEQAQIDIADAVVSSIKL